MVFFEKEAGKNSSLLDFRETKAIVVSNYVKKTLKIKKKISKNAVFAALSTF
jgi:hypothetical protein